MTPGDDAEEAKDDGAAVGEPWAVILSVLLVMTGLFVCLPLLLTKLSPAAARLSATLFIIPAFPAVTGWLQGCMDTRQKGESGLRALPREYVFHLWRLSLELTMLLASLPVIAAQILGVISAIIFITFVAVLLLAVVQQVFGWRMKGIAVFGWSDVWFSARLMLGSVTATVGFFALGVMLERVFDRSADMAASMNRRVMRWLQQHG